MHPKQLAPAFALLASALSAQVVIGPSPVPNHDALVSFPAGGAFGFFFDSVIDIGTASVGTRVSGAFLGERYWLFLVDAGTIFNTAYVSNHAPITGSAGLLWPYDQNGVYEEDPGTLSPHYLAYDESFENHSLLFAFWDDRAPFGGRGAAGIVDDSDLFGWMRVGFSLAEDPDSEWPVVQWSILNSAIAHGGTTAGQIPEPGAVPLLGGATAILVTVTRRRRRDQSALVRSL